MGTRTIGGPQVAKSASLHLEDQDGDAIERSPGRGWVQGTGRGATLGRSSLLLLLCVSASALVGCGDSPEETERKIEQTEREIGRNGDIAQALRGCLLGTGSYPTTQQGLAVLFERPTDAKPAVKMGPYLMGRPEDLVDPWGQPYRYRSPGIFRQEDYDLWSCGPNRIDEEGAGDDIKNWWTRGEPIYRRRATAPATLAEPGPLWIVGQIVQGVAGLALFVLLFASLWKVFTKAHEPGWAALIPVYNGYLLLQIAGLSGIYVFLLFVPLVNIVVLVALGGRLAARFGKGVGFGLGIAFLPFIFYPLLAFTRASYESREQSEAGSTGGSDLGGPPPPATNDPGPVH